MDPQFTTRRATRPPQFPNAIREYRLKAGLTQERLGRLIGRGRRAISEWERGHGLPSVTNLFKLAKTLGTLAEALYRTLYAPDRKETSTTHRKEA